MLVKTVNPLTLKRGLLLCIWFRLWMTSHSEHLAAGLSKDRVDLTLLLSSNWCFAVNIDSTTGPGGRIRLLLSRWDLCDSLCEVFFPVISVAVTSEKTCVVLLSPSGSLTLSYQYFVIMCTQHYMILSK